MDFEIVNCWEFGPLISTCSTCIYSTVSQLFISTLLNNSSQNPWHTPVPHSSREKWKPRWRAIYPWKGKTLWLSRESWSLLVLFKVPPCHECFSLWMCLILLNQGLFSIQFQFQFCCPMEICFAHIYIDHDNNHIKTSWNTTFIKHKASLKMHVIYTFFRKQSNF